MSADTSTGNERALVAAFYHFTALPDCEALRGPLQQSCEDLGLLGTILLVLICATCYDLAFIQYKPLRKSAGKLS